MVKFSGLLVDKSLYVKGVKKARPAIKLHSYYFIYIVPNDINVTEIL